MRFWLWLIARLLVAAVLLGWMFSAWLMPSSGDKEFRRSLEALKKINSVHLTMVADVPTQHSEEEADLVCSDDSYHRRTTFVVHQSGQDATINNEILRSGGQDYELLRSGMWKRAYTGLEAAQMTCKRLAQGTRAWIVPPIDEYIEHSVIEKGDKKNVNGEVCREWRVTTRVGPGPITSPMALEHRTICLGVDDHLPREMVIGNNGARWTYAFNQPMKIEPPSAIQPDPPQPDNYRPPPQGLTLADDKDAN